MQITLFSILEAILLVTALSVDAFVASFAYGADRIRIPFRSVALISGICSGILGLSMLAGRVLSPYLPKSLLPGICFVLLGVLGILKLFDSSLKALIRRHSDLHKKLQFSVFHLNVILNIYANPQQADRDHSSVLSAGEAAALAVALSLDGLTAGIGAGLGSAPVLEAVLFSLVLGMGAVLLGAFCGNRIAEKLKMDLSWISGLMLLVLAALKLI